MHGLEAGFWWANVLTCAYCTLYWATKRMGDGTPALMTPGGQVWAWQLIFSFVILLLGANPWHLLWLGLVSIVLSVIVSKFYRRRMLAARYPDIVNKVSGTDQEPSWIDRTAAEYLNGEINKNAFYKFIQDSPTLMKTFHKLWGDTLSPQRPLTRGRLTIMFNEAGLQLAKAGDVLGSANAFACSSLFIKGNPLTWAAIAVTECGAEDRVAVTWATKVIAFRLTKTASPDLREFLMTDEAKSHLKAARQVMKDIIAICEMSPSWRDTSTLVEQMGVTAQYFDR